MTRPAAKARAPSSRCARTRCRSCSSTASSSPPPRLRAAHRDAAGALRPGRGVVVPGPGHQAQQALQGRRHGARSTGRSTHDHRSRPRSEPAASRIRVGTASWTDKTLIAWAASIRRARRPPRRGCASTRRSSLVEVDSSYYAMPAPADRAALGRAHARRLRHERQGVPPLHRPPATALVHARRPARRPRRRRQAALLLPRRAAEIQTSSGCAFARRCCRCAPRAGWGSFTSSSRLGDGRRGRPGPCRALRRAHGAATISRSSSAIAAGSRAPTRRARRSPSCARWASPTPSSTGRRASPTACPRSGRRPIPRFALLRLHGRNAKTWNVKGATSASDRFNYDYPEHELAELVPRLERLALTALQTHVIFNNNMEDQGQRNAGTLTGLIAAHRPTV